MQRSMKRRIRYAVEDTLGPIVWLGGIWAMGFAVFALCLVGLALLS